MSERQIEDTASLTRQTLLAAALDRQAADLSIRAGGELAHGDSRNAWAMSQEVVRLRGLARQVRDRLGARMEHGRQTP